jgi:tRNA(Ile)-lysidine synthase
MPPLLERVRRTIRRHDLIPRGAQVLAAVSGGSDSVALLHLLLELRDDGDVGGVIVAHFNHRLRGPASDEDEAFCRALAASRLLPMVVESADVGQAARDDRTSIEQAGRRLRYGFLARAAESCGAIRVAVGHTRDDQAETFLLRLLRGAGPDGLGGIRPRAGLVVRPLLDVARTELRDYLSARRVAFREDASNDDVTVPRNRVRHELLPMLRDRFSPGIVETLSRAAQIARDDAEYLERAAQQAEHGIVSRTGEGVVLDVAALARPPLALARRIVRRAMEQHAPGAFVGFDAVAAVLDLADSSCPSGRQVDVPGLRAERRAEIVVLRSREGRRDKAEPRASTPFSYLLPVPGEVRLPEAGCRISAEVAPKLEEPPRVAGRRDVAVVSAAGLAGPLTVRSRMAGDAFRPVGLGGRKKLQDFFVDRKVQRAVRDRVPLVVDGHGRIVWVVGHAVGEEFRVIEPTEAVVVLRLKDLGGEA